MRSPTPSAVYSDKIYGHNHGFMNPRSAIGVAFAPISIPCHRRWNCRAAPICSVKRFSLKLGRNKKALDANFFKEAKRGWLTLHGGGGLAGDKAGKCGRNWALPVVRACKERSDEFSDSRVSHGDFEIASSVAVTVVFAVANRVLYKLALVPLNDYPFFLAQLTTFGYVVVYFSILYFRYCIGIVTNEMLALPKSRFIAIGALEALGVCFGMAAGANLSGASIPILTQTFLVWQLILSVLILRRRYTRNQIFGCLLVVAGVVMAVASGASTNHLLQTTGLFWPLLMIISSSFQACASIIKEFIFIDAAKRLKGGSVDLFVVNSFGSLFQALFVLLLLPFLSKIQRIPFNQLLVYFKDGATCFINIGSMVKGCDGAPLLPLLFILANMAFNISLLRLTKISSAVVSSLAATLAVPLSIYMFTLPLPYIGGESNLPPKFILGAVVLVIGLVMYNLPQVVKDAS